MRISNCEFRIANLGIANFESQIRIGIMPISDCELEIGNLLQIRNSKFAIPSALVARVAGVVPIVIVVVRVIALAPEIDVV